MADPPLGTDTRVQSWDEWHCIQVDKYNGRCRITLNRPEKRNALSARLQSELAEALKDADMDKTIHCVILCGAGKDFCAGYELNGDPVDTVDKMKTDYWRLWEEYDLDNNPKTRREV